MLHQINEKMLNDLQSFREKYNLSGPLLVNSESDFINNIKSQKNIMYIGQETNGWVNGNNINEYEETYKNFLYNNTYYRNFWNFLRMIINKHNSMDNVLWANALICGRKDEIGTPIVTDAFKELSLEYLLELYKFFRPDMTVIVSGPCNPYYDVIKEFLKAIDSKIVDEIPTRKDTLIKDYENNVFYTYHPNYQNRIACDYSNSLILKKHYDGILK